MLPCAWKYHLGIDCPGCGLQRSFWALFNGDVLLSLELFPALIPMILTFLFLLLHLKFKYRQGAKMVIVLFSLTAAVMVISYVIKIGQHGMHA